LRLISVVLRLEDLEQVANLKAGLTACYKPASSLPLSTGTRSERRPHPPHVSRPCQRMAISKNGRKTQFRGVCEGIQHQLSRAQLNL